MRNGQALWAVLKPTKGETHMLAAQAIPPQDHSLDNAATALGLVIRCYSAAIDDLKEAKELHEAGSGRALHDKVCHAQDIVTELLVGLDYERGGQIAQNLSRVYNFILRELIVIHNAPDTRRYDQLVFILEDLRSAWEQISRN